ncbi:hypothetical protein LEN26_002155 [Aphanomyces euteiches]|nr:hypothetical protein LEN26_002155 [Aphanomyces euteiches]
MLEKYFDRLSILGANKSLILYADNCGGQNKNNFVIKYLLMATMTGDLEQVDYNFFVKGHTKNACDRGFGHTRKKFLKTDCWTFEHIVNVVQTSSSSNDCVSLEDVDNPFNDYKSIVDELFSNLQGLQKFQMFRMRKSEPGIVECRRHPSENPQRFDLRRTYDGVVVSSDRAKMLWLQKKPLPLPRVNPEKARDLYTKIRPYVPQEFQNCQYYEMPSESTTAAAKRIKQARVEQQKR